MHESHRSTGSPDSKTRPQSSSYREFSPRAMTPLRKMSKAELRAIVSDYHSLLPGRQRIGDDAVGRADGPLMQCIGFERLRGGDYRPMNFVRVMVTPEPVSGFFHKIPQGWPVTLFAHQHDEYHRRMFQNMMREFRP